MEIDVYKEWLGIPEGKRPPDQYTLLRLVKFEDDFDKIKNNYRKLNGHVRKYATGQYLERSQELLNELARAMLCLTDPERKREYDESLGREFSDEDLEEPQTTLEILAAKKLITRPQIAEIQAYADARGISTRDAVVQMKLAEPDVATEALAMELRLPYVDLDDMLPDEDVLDKVPRNVVRRHASLPLFRDGEVMLVACPDVPDPEFEDYMRMSFGIPMRGVIALPKQINRAIQQYYAPGAREPVEETAAQQAAVSKRKDAETTKPEKKEKPKAKKNKSGPVSAEENQTRRNICIVVGCWVMIGTALSPYVFTGGPPGFVTLVLAVVLGASVVGVTRLFVWK